LKKKYPDSFITWLVGEESYDLLKNNPYIDRLMKYNHSSVIALNAQKFDMLINLDKASHMAALAMQIDAKDKRGYGLDEHGFVFPLNKEAEYHYSICLDNWGKKTINEKNYQELIFDIAGLKYRGEEYVINLPKESYDYASRFLKNNSITPSEIVIGLNTGCGPVYPHKRWTLENYQRLIDMLGKEIDAKVLLFGSHSEIELNKAIRSGRPNVIDTTGSTSIAQFASLINICDVVVTGDTAGMHLAIALKRPVVALFGPTPAQEINVYDRGVKLVGKVDCLNCYDQFPCDRSPTCMETITAEEVFDSILSLVNK